jgi:hypothetical protein
MDPDQPAHPRSLIRIHAVRLPTLLQVEKLKANANALCWFCRDAAQLYSNSLCLKCIKLYIYCKIYCFKKNTSEVKVVLNRLKSEWRTHKIIAKRI